LQHFRQEATISSTKVVCANVGCWKFCCWLTMNALPYMNAFQNLIVAFRTAGLKGFPHGLAFWRQDSLFGNVTCHRYNTKKTPWPESARELYRPSCLRLLAKLVPTFANRGCHVVGVTNPYGRILGFIDRNHRSGHLKTEHTESLLMQLRHLWKHSEMNLK
jgi:hypothetical protein